MAVVRLSCIFVIEICQYCRPQVSCAFFFASLVPQQCRLKYAVPCLQGVILKTVKTPAFLQELCVFPKNQPWQHCSRTKNRKQSGWIRLYTHFQKFHSPLINFRYTNIRLRYTIYLAVTASLKNSRKESNPIYVYD